MKEYRGCYVKIKTRVFHMGGVEYAFTITANGRETSLIAEAQMGMNEKCLTPKRTEYGKQVRKEYESGQLGESRHNMQQLEPREDGITNTLTSVQKDNLLLCGDDEVQPAAMRGREEVKVQEVGNLYRGETGWQSNQRGRVYDDKGIAPTIYDYSHGGGLEAKVPIKDKKYRIRKLTERECFRLMDVDEKDINTLLSAGISKTQLYKLAGNSIVVNCMFHMFRKLFVEPDNEEQQLTLW